MATVLIVDDSKTSRRILKNILIENGYEIIGEATDGQTGYEKYIEFRVGSCDTGHHHASS